MTHTLADWLAVVSFGIGTHAALSVPYFLTADADLCDFDPRPAMFRVLDTDTGARLLVATANGKHRARVAADRIQHSPRDAAITAAALLALLTITPGDTR